MEKVNGTFKRVQSKFRNTVEEGGRFPPETDRYHLYVALTCPWASRTLIMRKLKGLDFITVTVVSPRMGPDGWPFAPVDDYPGAEPDPLYNSRLVKDLYLRADPEFVGRYTVPVLWDKKQHTIVNNESADIVRMMNTAFNKHLPAEKAALDFYPTDLRDEIDAVEAWMYDDINNGVYKVGFALTFSEYRDAILPLFEALDRIEKLLAGKTYLIGNRLTEADIRLYVTIIRFDVAYVGRFNCNIRTIRGGYPNIHLWLRRLYWKNDDFQSTTDFQHIKTGYYSGNVRYAAAPFVPIGPVPHIEPL